MSASTQNPRPINTAIAGIGGYAGGELARLLLAHPRLQHNKPLFLGRIADEHGQTPLEHLHPHLALGAGRTQPPVEPFSWQLIAERKIDLVFLALPHENSRQWAPEWLAHGVKVVDLSGAWRLQHESNRAIYNLHDADPAAAESIQREAVFGCPELHRAQIASPTTRLVANPGCYSTSIILALAPLLQAGLLDLDHGIIADSKSGVSGAGKAPTPKTHFMYAADNLSAYAVGTHRHTGELLEQLHLQDAQIQFTPHLLPIPRGILSTIYARLKNISDPKIIQTCILDFYASSPLIRVRSAGTLPDIQSIVRSNFCDLGFTLAKDGRRLVLVSCLDNLLKGASGQAVQNMNLMCGYGEEEGLL